MGCGCGSVVKLLADYLERQLPPSLRQELEQHLQRCPRCVSQLRTYESTVSLLRSLRDGGWPRSARDDRMRGRQEEAVQIGLTRCDVVFGTSIGIFSIHMTGIRRRLSMRLLARRPTLFAKPKSGLETLQLTP
jgi:anti-sigma factor RsiW